MLSKNRRKKQRKYEKNNIANRGSSLFASGGALLFCLLLSASPYCKKKPEALKLPPSPSFFAWGKNVDKSISQLRDAGWKLKSQNAQEAVLDVPLELLKEEKNRVILKVIAQQDPPSLGKINLYSRKGKLMLARLMRMGTKKKIKQYKQRLLKDYGLEKALWSGQGKTSKDKTGNTHKSQMALYEQKELFVLIRHSFWEIAEESLSKGANHNMEALFYSKKNPKLSSQALIERLKKEAKVWPKS